MSNAPAHRTATVTSTAPNASAAAPGDPGGPALVPGRHAIPDIVSIPSTVVMPSVAEASTTPAAHIANVRPSASAGPVPLILEHGVQVDRPAVPLLLLQQHVGPSEGAPHISVHVPELREQYSNSRPRLRHYFTRATVLGWAILMSSRRYIPYDIQRGVFVDSTATQYVPVDPRGGEPDSRISFPRDFMVPRLDRCAFPPQWEYSIRLSIWVNFEHDVFYLSSAEFPCPHPWGDFLNRAQENIVRAGSVLGLRHRVAMLSEGVKWWERALWGTNLRWLWKAHKVALHAPTTGAPPHKFDLHRVDRDLIMRLRELRTLYLVVPRDPDCYHGVHRNWNNIRLNEDGFCTYNDFVAQHVALQNSSSSGGRTCNCYLDVDPTNGMAEWFEYQFQPRARPPRVVVVIEDLFR